jgi:hypothetical protein
MQQSTFGNQRNFLQKSRDVAKNVFTIESGAINSMLNSRVARGSLTLALSENWT